MNSTEVQTKLIELSERLKVIENFCQVAGPWVAPEQATKLCPLTRRRIMGEIAIAEANRMARKKTDLVYGVHYWNSLFPYEIAPEAGTIEDNGKAKNTWKIHYVKFWEIVNQPLEQRIL